MARICNAIVAVINAIFLLAGLATILVALFFYVEKGTQCEESIKMPLLIIGAGFIVVSMLGLIGACCRVNFFLIIHLTILFLMILALLGFTVFAIFVTNKDVSEVMSTGYEDYRLGDFSNWMRTHFAEGENWSKVKSCLLDVNICGNLGHDGVHDQFSSLFRKKFTSLQPDCCRPPPTCGLKSANATFWQAPKTGLTSKDADCSAWNNEQDKLCLDCDVCKVGFLDNIRRQWRHLAIFNCILLAVIVFAYCVGCFARRSNKSDNKKDKYRYRGYP
ncbi:hypothetical protein ACFE04_010101 [Oxalis oulophora]